MKKEKKKDRSQMRKEQGTHIPKHTHARNETGTKCGRTKKKRKEKKRKEKRPEPSAEGALVARRKCRGAEVSG